MPRTRTRSVRVRDSGETVTIDAAAYDPELHEPVEGASSSEEDTGPADTGNGGGEGGEGGGGEGDEGGENGAKVYTVTELRGMTRDELDALALSRELTVPDDANKPDVINLILDGQGEG